MYKSKSGRILLLLKGMTIFEFQVMVEAMVKVGAEAGIRAMVGVEVKIKAHVMVEAEVKFDLLVKDLYLVFGRFHFNFKILGFY